METMLYNGLRIIKTLSIKNFVKEHRKRGAKNIKKKSQWRIGAR
jgi:hypothetical protein